MESFSTASPTGEAGIAMQLIAAEHRDADFGSPFAVSGDSLSGNSINFAARIWDHARASQIFASRVIRQLATGKDSSFTNLGHTDLRGFDDSVQLGEIRWND